MSADGIEDLAIQAALGNNGGKWAEHYTAEQKEFWRTFVRKLQVSAHNAAIDAAADVAKRREKAAAEAHLSDTRGGSPYAYYVSGEANLIARKIAKLKR